MKLSKPQRRYLEAIARCDWKQRNKDGSPAMRKWARENELVIQDRRAGGLPQTLTQKARNILSNDQEQATTLNPKKIQSDD